jgi:UDP-2,3-diacylglucosamine pyrophosphatase LpxH
MFDGHNFNKMSKLQVKIFDMLRDLYDSNRLICIAGNHDGPIDRLEAITGIAFKPHYTLIVNNKLIYLEHGDKADKFLVDHPVMTAVGDWIYYVLQKIDRTHRLARIAKNSSKTYFHATAKVADYALRLVSETKYQAMICGHTHQATYARMGGAEYFNVGCWTEKPCTLATINSAGSIQLRTYRRTKGGLSDPLFIETEVV